MDMIESQVWQSRVDLENSDIPEALGLSREGQMPLGLLQQGTRGFFSVVL